MFDAKRKYLQNEKLKIFWYYNDHFCISFQSDVRLLQISTIHAIIIIRYLNTLIETGFYGTNWILQKKKIFYMY